MQGDKAMPSAYLPLALALSLFMPLHSFAHEAISFKRAVAWAKRSVPKRFFSRIRRIHLSAPPSTPYLLRLNPLSLTLKRGKSLATAQKFFLRRMQNGLFLICVGTLRFAHPARSAIAWWP
jgi:hypothetical protein